MIRAVLAEPWWIREEANRTVGLGYPKTCNTGGALGFVHAVYAAWRQSPKGITLGVTANIGLKFWWLQVVINHYNQGTARRSRD